VNHSGNGNADRADSADGHGDAAKLSDRKPGASGRSSFAKTVRLFGSAAGEISATVPAMSLTPCFSVMFNAVSPLIQADAGQVFAGAFVPARDSKRAFKSSGSGTPRMVSAILPLLNNNSVGTP